MERKELIQTLEKERESRVITYITGDRQPFGTRIAADVIPLLNSILTKVDKTQKISLFLFTNGGDMLAPLRIVKLIRNHCDEFEVLIPYKAHSAGTLIALGADKIVMGRLGELSPVDPSTGHPFNPQHPLNPQARLEINVEDLNSFFLLAREKAGVKEDQMVEIYKQLVDKLHPLALGNAYRAARMARAVTQRLLELHMNPETEERKIQRITKEITEDITIHAYPIDRDESLELGLRVEKIQGNTEASMWSLYQQYAEILKPGQQLNPNEFLQEGDIAEFNQTGAYLESKDATYEFIFSGKVRKEIRNNQQAIDINIASQSWVEKYYER